MVETGRLKHKEQGKKDSTRCYQALQRRRTDGVEKKNTRKPFERIGTIRRRDGDDETAWQGRCQSTNGVESGSGVLDRRGHCRTFEFDFGERKQTPTEN